MFTRRETIPDIELNSPRGHTAVPVEGAHTRDSPLGSGGVRPFSPTTSNDPTHLQPSPLRAFSSSSSTMSSAPHPAATAALATSGESGGGGGMPPLHDNRRPSRQSIRSTLDHLYDNAESGSTSHRHQATNHHVPNLQAFHNHADTRSQMSGRVTVLTNKSTNSNGRNRIVTFRTKRDSDSSSTSDSSDDDYGDDVTSTAGSSGIPSTSTPTTDGAEERALDVDASCCDTTLALLYYCGSVIRRYGGYYLYDRPRYLLRKHLLRRPRGKEELEYTSLFIWEGQNLFRMIIYNLVHTKVFEGIIILSILLNCVILALDDPTLEVEPPWQQGLNLFFVAVFTVEMVLKIIGFGLILHRGAYLRNPWNVLDFVIVLLSYLQMVPGFGNFTAFRTLRVLRPLRSMNAVPQLKLIATCLLHSVKGLANVLALAIFVYLVFAILAVQLWMGNLMYRCRFEGSLHFMPDMFCTNIAGGSVVGKSCPMGMSCEVYENPNGGYTNYDNVLWALLVVFQTVTLEGWSTIMFISMDACGWYAAAFFVLLVVMGSYFVLNLCLAVISFHFENVNNRMIQEQMELAKEEEMENRQTDEGITRMRQSMHLGEGAIEDLLRKQQPPPVAQSTHGGHSDAAAEVAAHYRIVHPLEPNLSSIDASHLLQQLQTNTVGRLLLMSHREEIFSEDNCQRIGEFFKNARPSIRWPLVDSMWYRICVLRSYVVHFVEADPVQHHMESARNLEVLKLELLQKDEEAYILAESVPDAVASWFQKFIFFCIIVNTIVLAAEHFNEDPLQLQVASVFNIIFSWVFAAEMTFKVIGFGPIGYVRDPFNLFDGAVTIISLVEILALSGNSTFSVFRAFRMLRVLRLFRGVPSLRSLIEVFGLALAESGYLIVILALYFLMASLIGMQLFSDQLQLYGLKDDDSVRSSFSTFVRAFYTVLQILTYDSWPNIMWSAMEATNEAASIYFILCILLGNLCVLNLLIAILINSFDVHAKKHLHRRGVGTQAPLEGDLANLAAVEAAPFFVETGLAVTLLSAGPPTTRLMPQGVLLPSNPNLGNGAANLGASGRHRGNSLIKMVGDQNAGTAVEQKEGGGEPGNGDLGDGGVTLNVQPASPKFESDGVNAVTTTVAFSDSSNDASNRSGLPPMHPHHPHPTSSSNKRLKADTKKASTATIHLGNDNNSNHAGSKNSKTGGSSTHAVTEPSSQRKLMIEGIGQVVDEEVSGSDDEGVLTPPQLGPVQSQHRAVSSLPLNKLAQSNLTAKSHRSTRGASKFDDSHSTSKSHNAAQAAARMQSLQQVVGYCELCADPIYRPYDPISKSILPITPLELHDRMCEKIQFRKVKERVIESLLELMRSDKGPDDEDESEDEFGIFGTLNNSFSKNADPLLHGAEGQDSGGLAGSGSFRLAAGWALASPAGNPLNVDSAFPSNALKDAASKNVEKRVAITPAMVEDAFGRAWEVGLLLGENVEDYLYAGSWSSVRKLLREEYALLQLRIGEEQIGHALLAYTRANVPQQILTNGGYSLFIFGPRNRLRVILTTIVANKFFDYGILFIVLLSSALMAADNPKNDEETSNTFETIGNVFTAIFCVEALMKIIAYGFVLWPRAYLRDPWNVLDFVVVVVSVISWILSATISFSSLTALKALRTMRVLRPLRLIGRNRGLRMVVMTLFQSIKGIANMTLILFLVFLVFAILGVQLFGGIMYRCNDPSISLRVDCVGTFNKTFQEVGPMIANVSRNATSWEMQNVTGLVDRVVTRERHWENAEFHFDNTAAAMLSLFHISTLDDWGTTLYALTDATDHDHGPNDWVNTVYGLYICAFVLIGSLFMMNMFVGLIIFNFQSAKEKMDGSSLLTDEQKLWVETQRMMLSYRPQRRRVAQKSEMQQAVGHLVEETYFEVASAVVIFLNVVIIAMEHKGQSAEFTTILYALNVLFTALFVLEAVLKIFAYGSRYFLDGWNQFDFFLVLLGIVDIATDGALPVNFALLRVLRVFRIMRILVLVRKARDIRVLLETLWYSIPSLANIGAFMFLTIFVFTVLGVQLFALIPQDGIGLTPHTNFEDFGTAFLFLIQVTTLDNWGITMASIMDPGACPPDNPDCGNPYAPFFFVPFILLSGYVMVNLFCAIILDNFDTTMELDKSKLKVTDLRRFAEAWALFDEDATMLTETKNFPRLLAALKPPLGIEWLTDRMELLQKAEQYVIPEHGGVIHFVETMIPLARKALEVQLTHAEIREHEDNWRTQFPDLKKLRVLRYRQKRVTVDQYFAATYIKGACRRRLAVRAVNEVRREKAAEMKQWYDEHNVPEEERHALHKMEKEELKRKEASALLLQKINEMIEREKQKQLSRHNSVVEHLELSNSTLRPSRKGTGLEVGGEDGAGGVGTGLTPARRRPSGLTGFSQLWSKVKH